VIREIGGRREREGEEGRRAPADALLCSKPENNSPITTNNYTYYYTQLLEKDLNQIHH
jgi:hypothetical protein